MTNDNGTIGCNQHKGTTVRAMPEFTGVVEHVMGA